MPAAFPPSELAMLAPSSGQPVDRQIREGKNNALLVCQWGWGIENHRRTRRRRLDCHRPRYLWRIVRVRTWGDADHVVVGKVGVGIGGGHGSADRRVLTRGSAHG